MAIVADNTKEPKTQKASEMLTGVVVRFAGDSGDGMQLTGDQFTDTTAEMGNDFSTFPDYPAEIRAPAGTLPGVSSFQIQFSNEPVSTHGDIADVLVAMNPAALKVNLINLKAHGLVIINESTFTENNLRKAAWKANPLEDTTLKNYHVLKIPISELTHNALKEHAISNVEKERCKNFFALGMMFWLYDRSLTHTIRWIEQKFAKRPEIVKANIDALKAGHHYADIAETVLTQYIVEPAKLQPGTYRKITGNQAAAIGLVTAAHLAKKILFYGSYPITPASSILHELAKHKNYRVKTFQAEDEIAAVGVAIGAAFGGELGVTGTSGPGLCLKSEAINLAVMAELPLVIVDVQRGGPSTGMPTKTEQGDLLQSLYGRNGESPLVVLAAKTPQDCFQMAIEAVRLAIKYMTPVILLSEGYLAEASEPWKLPDIEKLPQIIVNHPAAEETSFLPYLRDPQTLARPWAKPGTPGLEHRIGGLSKAENTGAVSYDPENNQRMIELRADKIKGIENDIPELTIDGPDQGKLLVLGWGGTYGAIHQAIYNLKKTGEKVSHVQLSYLNPFPRNLGAILKNFNTVLIPELNTGQLLTLIRAQFPGTTAIGLHKVKGQPFRVDEITQRIKELI